MIMDRNNRHATASMLCIPSRFPGHVTVATKVLWMLNLPNVCSKQDIELVIARVAEVVSIEINPNRNYCFVTFKSRVDCFDVIKSLAKNCWINENQVNICYAKSKGMLNDAFNTLWDGKKGIMLIPWELLSRDISQLVIDTYVDVDSLPEHLRGVIAAPTATTSIQYSQPQARRQVVPRDMLLVHSPVYGELPLEVHSPTYGSPPIEVIDVSSPVYSNTTAFSRGMSRRRDSDRSRHRLEVQSPTYGAPPIEVIDVSSPVYSNTTAFSRGMSRRRDSDRSRHRLEVQSPTYGSPQIEVMDVSSPVYTDTTAFSHSMSRRGDSDRSRLRRDTSTTYRDADRGRSRSPDPRCSRKGYNRARRTVQSKHRFERSAPHGSMEPPAPLREVDKSIFEVYTREVFDCPTTILDSSIALRATRGRGNAMAFARCTFNSTATKH